MERRLKVEDLFAFSSLREARVVAGRSGLNRRVVRINVMQVPTDRYAKPDELLLAAAPVFADRGDTAALLDRLAERGVAALAVRGAELDKLLPREALDLVERRALPLIELPSSIHLEALMTELLETLVADQYVRLRDDSDVRDRLTGYVLAGGDLHGLPDAVAELVEGDVAIFDAAGSELGASSGADRDAASRVASAWVSYEGREPLEATGGWMIWPILAGRERLGAVVAHPSARGGLPVAALEHGATNAALQLLHEREAHAADVGFREGFFRDLVHGSLETQAAERRARAIGWGPERYRVALLDGAQDGTDAIADRTIVAQHNGARLVVLADSVDALAALASGNEGAHVGISRAHAGFETLPGAVLEAEEALDSARRFDARVGSRRFEDLGPLRMLSRVPAEELQAFCDDVLGPLDAQPPDLGNSLVQTLELLLATGLNVAETARRGRWHYNTVRYRVRRLVELLGPFLEDGSCLESLALALLVRSELGSGGS